MTTLLIGGLGMGEMLIILVVVLLIFGAGKLPQVGDALGRGIRNFKKSASGNDEIDVTPKAAPQTALPPSDGKSVVDAREVTPSSEQR